MDSLESDDQLTIINRSTEHRISKKLIRRIPYFEKMLSHECMESKENKVELDLDEKTFKMILDWIEMGLMYIKMDNVINLCTMADYFGMNDDLIKDCVTYFHEKFHVRNLPVIITQVTLASKIIDSRVLNAFICRHFLKIVETSSWWYFPFETIDYICNLDLMIDSEIKVFDAIVEWTTQCNSSSRKSHLKALLNSVRWCHIKSNHLTKVKENELIKSEGFEPLFCSPDNVKCVCCCNRTKQEYFIATEDLEGTDLRIKVLDSNFLPFINQVFRLDASMPLNVFHDAHISDILFDSGRKLIRVDWKQNKYRMLDYKAHVSHYFEIARCFVSRFNISYHKETKNHSRCKRIYGSSLLEANGKFILLHIYDGCVAYWLGPKAGNIESKLFDYENNFISTILGENIYILTKNFDFMAFTIGLEELKIYCYKKLAEQLKFDDLFLISSQVENEIFLVDKSTKNVFRFRWLYEEWDPIGLLINYDYSKTGGQKEPIELLTFTTAFLSIDAIRPCLKRKLDSIVNEIDYATSFEHQTA